MGDGAPRDRPGARRRRGGRRGVPRRACWPPWTRPRAGTRDRRPSWSAPRRVRSPGRLLRAGLPAARPARPRARIARCRPRGSGSCGGSGRCSGRPSLPVGPPSVARRRELAAHVGAGRPASARRSAVVAAGVAAARRLGQHRDDLRRGSRGSSPAPGRRRRCWICAVRQSDGRRVVFGRRRTEPPVPEAVAASCAIPGFFRPVDGRRRAPHRRWGALAHQRRRAAGRDAARPRAGELTDVPPGPAPPVAPDQAMRPGRARCSMRRLAGSVAGASRWSWPSSRTPRCSAAMGLNAMDPRRRKATAEQSRTSTLVRLAEPRVADRLARLSS